MHNNHNDTDETEAVGTRAIAMKHLQKYNKNASFL